MFKATQNKPQQFTLPLCVPPACVLACVAAVTPPAMISWMEEEIKASPDMAVIMVRWAPVCLSVLKEGETA